MEWVEKTAKSVDEAKEAALDALGVHEDDAEFDVVSDVKTGMFGRVKEDARVRARVRPTTPRSKDDRRRKRGRGGNSRGRGGKGGHDRQNGGESQGSSREAGQSNGSRGGGRPAKQGGDQRSSQSGGRRGGAPKSEKKQAPTEEKSEKMHDEPSMPLPEQADVAEQFVKGLAEAMGANVEFAREQVEDDEIRITVTGENLGRMVGPRGGTAMAVDDLVRTVLQRHGSSRDGRIRVDIGGLRARRAEALAAFCRDQAEAVRADGVARVLDPMGGADRKIVHDTLAEESGVATTSEGEDPNRRVVIVPAGDAG